MDCWYPACQNLPTRLFSLGSVTGAATVAFCNEHAEWFLNGAMKGDVSMPFKSKKQMRWMFANKPKLAKKWAKKYGTKPKGKKKRKK